MVGAGGDFAAFASHHAGDGARLLGVADEEHRLVEVAILAVERTNLLAGTCVAHYDRLARKRAVVERMHRLPALEHHVVRDVHEQTERAHATRLETLCHEIWRGAVLDRSNHARRVARTTHRVLHDHFHLVVHVGVGLHDIDGRHLERTPQDRRKLTSESNYAQRIGTVPRHFDVKDRLWLLATYHVAHERTDWRLGRKLHDARVVATGKRKFLRTAEHAERLHAAQLALLDLESAVRHNRADLRESCLEASAAIRRATHDLQRLLAIRDSGLVEVRTLDHLAGEHFGDNEEIGKRFRSGRLYRLDLQTAARETLGQVGRGDVGNVNVFIQPTERQFHLASLLLSSYLLQQLVSALPQRE